MEQLYCIECEMNLNSKLHEQANISGYHNLWFIPAMGEWTICEGPFAFSAPPEIEDGWYGTGWQDNLEEIDPEELEMMDRAAESLELEFING